MIPDGVSGVHDGSCDVGALLDEASNQKERGARIVLSQHFQQAKSVRVVRAIVVGESDLLGAPRQANKALAIPLACRCHGLVSSGAHKRSCTRTDQGFEHGAILAEARDLRFVILDLRFAIADRFQVIFVRRVRSRTK